MPSLRLLRHEAPAGANHSGGRAPRRRPNPAEPTGGLGQNMRPAVPPPLRRLVAAIHYIQQQRSERLGRPFIDYWGPVLGVTSEIRASPRDPASLTDGWVSQAVNRLLC